MMEVHGLRAHLYALALLLVTSAPLLAQPGLAPPSVMPGYPVVSGFSGARVMVDPLPPGVVCSYPLGTTSRTI